MRQFTACLLSRNELCRRGIEWGSGKSQTAILGSEFIVLNWSFAIHAFDGVDYGLGFPGNLFSKFTF